MPKSSDFNHFVTNPVNLGISRSIQDLSHGVKFSCNVGEVIPFEATMVLPGDTFTVDTSKVIRLQPMVCPVMDDLYADFYWFFIPNRLIWDHWVNFMGENTASAWTPSVEYTIPQIKPPAAGWNVGTIADYLGFPTGVGYSRSPSDRSVSALPFRAYALTMDQWFRSEVVDTPVHVYKDDTTRTGVNTGNQVTDIELGGLPYIACKMADYFNTCTPSPQKGPAVNIFNNVFAPVVPLDVTANWPAAIPNGTYTNGIGSLQMRKLVYGTGDSTVSVGDTNSRTLHSYVANPGNKPLIGVKDSTNITSMSSNDEYEIPANLWADLNSVNPFTINDLRTAFAIQRFMERQAISGSRYIEYIKAFYNVDSPDARLQRVEYLGGNRLPINVSQVTQTSATDSITPQGNVAGMSHTGDNHSDFTKSFTEDGILLGCMVVRYKNSYQQGVNRQWLQKTKYDFYNPVFANLGNQAVKQDEIYWADSIEGKVFGYQEAWSHYRSLPNRVAGELRSSASTPLDMWHFADNYAAAPSLSSSWMHVDKSNVDRSLAVTSSTSNQIICDIYMTMHAARPMPSYSIPGLIDHN